MTVDEIEESNPGIILRPLHVALPDGTDGRFYQRGDQTGWVIWRDNSAVWVGGDDPPTPDDIKIATTNLAGAIDL